jgi:hypothetical protein
MIVKKPKYKNYKASRSMRGFPYIISTLTTQESSNPNYGIAGSWTLKTRLTQVWNRGPKSAVNPTKLTENTVTRKPIWNSPLLTTQRWSHASGKSKETLFLMFSGIPT